jgi:signal transduction histidine kinase
VLSHGLSPVSFEENGLTDALRKLAKDTSSVAKVNCEFEETTSGAACDPRTAEQLYRIGQEAVTNALKHGRANKIQIAMEVTPQRVELRVSDDGKGFSYKSPNGSGLGLRAMKYRADQIGAELRIDSEKGNGTRVTCTLRRQP